MLFKILHGDISRISTDITPFHEGYCYVTHNGDIYVDMNIGTTETPNNQRIKLNAKDAETLTGMSLDDIQATALETSQSYTDDEIKKIKNGLYVAKNATNADNANNANNATWATHATQDTFGNTITTTYETKSDANYKLTEAKIYADTAANAVKDDLLNGAGTAYDTLKELGDLIDDNKDAIDALEDIASGKANAVHIHAISDVAGLQTALDGKAASSHGTHVSYPTTAPVMDGTASVGTASTVARSDHKHPTDTSRASKTEFDTHTSNTTIHITSTERTNWNAAKTHADSAHAPINAEKNQNAFSNIAVSGQTTVTADTTTDTVTFVGSNVSITTDATNDKVTFAVADGSTSVKGLVQLTNSTSSTSTTTAATPNSVKSAYDLANTAKTNAANAQTKADSAYSLAEGKVDSLSDLGITATATELNYVDGVTSNIQTQLNGKAASSHDHSATNITSGTLSSSRLPTVPVTKGGTGASNAVDALTNLGIYIGPDEPTDTNIRIWINTAEEGTGVVPVLPRIATITLTASGWQGSSNPWSQVVSIPSVTANSKIDLQPTAQQIVALQDADIALMAENNNGVVTIYALGGKPTSNYTMQALLTEVAYV